MNAICLVIDRLHIGYVGAYGNCWIDTPHLDQLSAESRLFDAAIINSPDLNQLYRSYWLGEFLQRSSDGGANSLPRILSEGGIHSALVCDDPLVSNLPMAGKFDESIAVNAGAATCPAATLDETRLANFFANASSWLETNDERPFLLWLHTGALAGPWDAPLDLRNQYVDEGEEMPPDSVDVPCQVLDQSFDPDVLLGWRRAYAGQVTLLDRCIGAWRQALSEIDDLEETLLVVLSARGLPMGEHGRLGAADEALFSELVHVPWWIKLPGIDSVGARAAALIQPPDVFATLLEWFSLTSSVESPWGRSLLGLARDAADASAFDRAGIVSPDGQSALRTPRWYLRRVSHPDETGADRVATQELYVKPDDRWEVNQVAERCSQEVETLEAAWHDLLRQAT